MCALVTGVQTCALPICLVLREQQLLGHVIDQQRAHPVVGEQLPHLGQEQDRQPARLAKPGFLGPCVHDAAFAPQTSSPQEIWPSSSRTEGVRSAARKIGPPRSTTSQNCPRTNAAPAARPVPPILPTTPRLPTPPQRRAPTRPRDPPPHLVR